MGQNHIVTEHQHLQIAIFGIGAYRLHLLIASNVPLFHCTCSIGGAHCQPLSYPSGSASARFTLPCFAANGQMPDAQPCGELQVLWPWQALSRRSLSQ